MIKGKVLDVQGESIIGANVIIKGTSNGVITDIDGNFTLDNVQVGSVIQISYIGYLTKEVKITGNTTELKIALPLIIFCCVIPSTISIWDDVEPVPVAHNDPVAIKASDAPNTILLERELQCLSFLFINI